MKLSSNFLSVALLSFFLSFGNEAFSDNSAGQGKANVLSLSPNGPFPYTPQKPDTPLEPGSRQCPNNIRTSVNRECPTTECRDGTMVAMGSSC